MHQNYGAVGMGRRYHFPAMKCHFANRRVLLALVLGVWSPGVLFLLCSNSDLARKIRSYFQSGAQVYFDEGAFSNNCYKARVTAVERGAWIMFGDMHAVAGSTLPDMSGTNDFPVVESGALAFRRGTHFGSVTNALYNSPNTPALILNPGSGTFAALQGLPVATTNTNRSRYAGSNFGMMQASQVHVHTGLSSNQTGSASCLTIAPDHALAFFSSKIEQSGVVHIKR